VLIIILTLFSSTRESGIDTFGSDVTHLVSSPVRWKRSDYVKFTGVAASFGTTMLLDDEIREKVQNYNGNLNDLADMFTSLGGGYGIGLLGGGLLIGYLSGNDELKHLSLRTCESALISSGLTYLIKMTAGRKRPYLKEGPYEWTGPNMEAGRMSMPSGHTTFAFAVASYLSFETENPLIDVLSYTCAIMVAYSRIKDDKHWASDVFLGAAIGISVGITISKID